jgi:flagellar export protein FliJ
MAKFEFRLATLLRLREATRDERRSELAQACQAERILEDQRRRIAKHLRESARRTREACAPGPLDLDRLLEARRYELVLRSQQRQVEQQCEAVQAEVQRRRDAVVEANRQVRVLESLREKQLQRHHREQNRLEIKQLDEVAGRHVSREDDR